MQPQFGNQAPPPRRLRILLCIATMEGGGAERQFAYLAEGLVTLGMDVHVMFFQRGPNYDRLRASGAHLHECPAKGFYNPRIFYYLLRLVRRLRPDIIHTWMLFMDVVGGTVARLTRRAWIISERSSGRSYPAGLKVNLRARMAGRAQAIISNSSAGDAYWQTVVGPKVSRQIIPNALPLDKIQSAVRLTAAEAGVRDEAKLIFFAGRFDPVKNLETLVRAVADVAAQAPVNACLAGHGPEREAIQRRVEELGLADCVRLPGFLENLWAWMKRADVFVSISHYEGLPNTVLEAMACGCPLVVSDIPPHREILDESTAWLVDPNRPEQVARAILSALHDPQEARTRAERARVRVKHLSNEEIAAQYLAVYRTVLGNASSTSTRPESRPGPAWTEPQAISPTSKL